MTDPDPFPLNPYGDVEVDKMIHDMSVFPHGRYEPPPIEHLGTPVKTIREAQANCPYCPSWVKLYARKELERIENDRPEASEH
jgi:hypothetical protein